jgi:hypothetical protein
MTLNQSAVGDVGYRNAFCEFEVRLVQDECTAPAIAAHLQTLITPLLMHDWRSDREFGALQTSPEGVGHSVNYALAVVVTPEA